MFYIIIYINQVYFKVGRLLETHLKINQKNIHLVDNEMSLINIQKNWICMTDFGLCVFAFFWIVYVFK